MSGKLKWNNAAGPPTEANWDSYGGLPTTPEAIAAAERIVSSMREGRFVVVPLSRGGVQIVSSAGEWEVVIEPDGSTE